MNRWTDKQLVHIDCNLCGQNQKNEKVIFTRPDGLHVVQCMSCGLVYLNPRPREDLIRMLYNNDYFNSQSHLGYANYFSEEQRQNNIISAKRKLLALKKEGISVLGRVLEVGCGTGEFCNILHNKGVDVTGIDISEAAIIEGKRRYRYLNLHVGTIESIDTKTKYNAIFAFELIEHLIDPNNFFKLSSELLEKNGFLCITTPSFEYGKKVGFEKWIGFNSSFEHLYFFSSDIIEKYALKHDMIVECRLYGGSNGLKKNNKNQNTIRDLIKEKLSDIHILGFLQKVRRKIKPIKHNYKNGEIGHNLLMILRKRDKTHFFDTY